MSRTLQNGDVIAQIDERGRFVELWLVAMVNVKADSVCPYKIRRACRPRTAVEEWDGFSWRFSEHSHNFQTPPEKR